MPKPSRPASSRTWCWPAWPATRAKRRSRRARATNEKSLEDKLKEDAKHQQMAELYRQHVLKEAPKPPVIQIQGLKKIQPCA